MPRPGVPRLAATMMARPSPEPRSITKSFGVSLARSYIFSSVTNGVGTQTESLPGMPGTGSNGFFDAPDGVLGAGIEGERDDTQRDGELNDATDTDQATPPWRGW